MSDAHIAIAVVVNVCKLTATTTIVILEQRKTIEEYVKGELFQQLTLNKKYPQGFVAFGGIILSR